MYLDLDYDFESEFNDPLLKLGFLTEDCCMYGDRLSAHSDECALYVSIINDYVLKAQDVLNTLVLKSFEIKAVEREFEESLREEMFQQALIEQEKKISSKKSKKTSKKADIVPIRPTE